VSKRSLSSATGALTLLLGLAACGGGKPAPGAGPTPAPRQQPQPLFVQPLAGEAVAVVPITLALAEEGVPPSPLFADRARLLVWADSVVGATLQARAPEAKWILPPDLRKISRRSVGIAPDPDRMGQAVMRAENLKDVPDPLRGHLRNLMALAGGRYAMVPASLVFVPEGTAIRAELSMVLADTRTGRVVWRSLAWGRGATPEAALAAALASVLPIG
jgi:hypothetical protein